MPVTVLNANTKRETGKKAQEGNIAAAKVQGDQRAALLCPLPQPIPLPALLPHHASNPQHIFLCAAHASMLLLQAVSDIIRTTLGPRSMLKMLLDPNGGEHLPAAHSRAVINQHTAAECRTSAAKGSSSQGAQLYRQRGAAEANPAPRLAAAAQQSSVSTQQQSAHQHQARGAGKGSSSQGEQQRQRRASAQDAAADTFRQGGPVSWDPPVSQQQRQQRQCNDPLCVVCCHP
jgi:hypothetical protein